MQGSSKYKKKPHMRGSWLQKRDLLPKELVLILCDHPQGAVALTSALEYIEGKTFLFIRFGEI